MTNEHVTVKFRCRCAQIVSASKRFVWRNSFECLAIPPRHCLNILVQVPNCWVGSTRSITFCYWWSHSLFQHIILLWHCLVPSFVKLISGSLGFQSSLFVAVFFATARNDVFMSKPADLRIVAHDFSVLVPISDHLAYLIEDLSFLAITVKTRFNPNVVGTVFHW